MLWNASWFKRNEPSKKHHLFLGSVRAAKGVSRSIRSSRPRRNSRHASRGRIADLEEVRQALDAIIRDGT
jgi:hypothetical protein